MLKTTSVTPQGRQRAADEGVLGRNHWRPQFSAACDSTSTSTVVTHIPVEMLGVGLDVFATAQGISGLSDPGGANVSSSHYVKRVKRMLHNASQVPFDELESEIPSYSSFYTEPTITRDICCLFANDVHLYRAACAEAWVSVCEGCVAACKRELERLQVCDLAPAAQTQVLAGKKKRKGRRRNGGKEREEEGGKGERRTRDA